MATKIYSMYGPYSHTEAKQLSEHPGAIVFSSATQEIWIGGSTVANYSSLNESEFQKLVERVTTLEEAVEAIKIEELKLNPRALAKVDANALTIFGVKQEDGKVSIDETKSIAINIDGKYDAEKNKIATQETVDTAVKELSTQIFGTLNPAELDKTIDTIKEIQKYIKGGLFVTKTTTNPETSETTTELIEVKRESGEGDIIEQMYYTDADNNKVVVATVSQNEGGGNEVTYATDGNVSYSDLVETQDISTLLNKVEANEKSIETINGDVNENGSIKNEITKALATNLISVKENEVKEFVTLTANIDGNYNKYSIGVNYGKFKTGHGNVFDETSEAFTNGIATVEDIQKYIEERLTWYKYETSSESVANAINESGTDTYTVNNSAEVSGPFVIKNKI